MSNLDKVTLGFLASITVMAPVAHGAESQSIRWLDAWRYAAQSHTAATSPTPAAPTPAKAELPLSQPQHRIPGINCAADGIALAVGVPGRVAGCAQSGSGPAPIRIDTSPAWASIDLATIASTKDREAG